jgi:hypothetical protein
MLNDMQPRGLGGGILPSFRTAKKQRMSESRIIIRHWFDPKAVDKSRELGRMDHEFGWRPGGE